MRIVICKMNSRRARDMVTGAEFWVLFVDGIATHRAKDRDGVLDLLRALA